MNVSIYPLVYQSPNTMHGCLVDTINNKLYSFFYDCYCFKVIVWLKLSQKSICLYRKTQQNPKAINSPGNSLFDSK